MSGRSRPFRKSTLASFNPEYDVTLDGRRFIVRERPADEPALAVHVVHNWFEEFRERIRSVATDR